MSIWYILFLLFSVFTVHNSRISQFPWPLNEKLQNWKRKSTSWFCSISDFSFLFIVSSLVSFTKCRLWARSSTDLQKKDWPNLIWDNHRLWVLSAWLASSQIVLANILVSWTMSCGPIHFSPFFSSISPMK